MSRTLRARVTRAETAPRRVRVTVTENERSAAHAQLAEVIERTTEAAEAGDQVAVYRLGGIAALIAAAVRARPDQPADEQLAQELEAIAARYIERADLPDKATREAARRRPFPTAAPRRT